MDRDRDRLREIERHEAWLGSYASPLPSGEVLGRVKRAVGLELEAAVLLGETRSAPTPSPELLGRVKAQVRRELAGRPRRTIGSWWGSAGLSAAACLALLAGLTFQSLAPGRGPAAGYPEQELAEFVESLAGVLEAGDVQLALLEQDVGDLEQGAGVIGLWGSQSVDADLDEVRQAIDSLGDETSLWLEDMNGDDV
jgi:hypothetical protein